MAAVSRYWTVICLRNAVLLCLTYCLLFTYSTFFFFSSPSTGGQQEGHSLHRGSHEWNQSKETAEARGRHSGAQQQFLSLRHFSFLSSLCLCGRVVGWGTRSNSSYNTLFCTSDIMIITYMTGVDSCMSVPDLGGVTQVCLIQEEGHILNMFGQLCFPHTWYYIVQDNQHVVFSTSSGITFKGKFFARDWHFWGMCRFTA